MLSWNLIADLLWTWSWDCALWKENKPTIFLTLQNHIQGWFFFFFEINTSMSRQVFQSSMITKTPEMDYLLTWMPQNKTVVYVVGMKASFTIEKETNCVLLAIYNFSSPQTFAILVLHGFWLLLSFLVYSQLKLGWGQKDGKDVCDSSRNFLIKENQY